jgi:hypothetical protein
MLLEHYTSLIRQKTADIRVKLTRNLTIILLMLIGLLIGSSMVMIAYQGADTRKLAVTTSQLSASTNQIVKSQTEILNAIKKVTDDTRLTAEQQTTIIICMLQVPQQLRTTDVERSCRKSITGASGTSQHSTQATSNTSAGSGAKSLTGSSSSKGNPKSNGKQSNNPQPAHPLLCTLTLHLLGCNKKS